MQLLLYSINAVRMLTRLFRKPQKVVVGKIVYMERFRGKNIIVIGGSSGIGLNIAENLIAEGGNVLITGRNEGTLKRAQAKCHRNCQYLVWDITDFTAMPERLSSALSMMNNRIDCVVYSAGVYINSRYSMCTNSDWDASFDTNIESFIRSFDGFIDAFKSNENGGGIVVINSIRGVIHDTSPYSLSKTALMKYAMHVSNKLDGTNIRLNILAPGPTAGTQINMTNSESDISTNVYVGGRFLIPQEISTLALFLLSEASRYLNGQVLVCDAGESLI